MTDRGDEEGSSADQLLQRAKTYHFRETLPPEEYEALMEIGAEIVHTNAEEKFFILGSYGDPEKVRLCQLRDKINSLPETDAKAYLMEDLADGLHPVVQFWIIADYSDHIIGVLEHDRGGFQLELGMLLAMTRYNSRFHLLKRSYPEKERERYNWMLDAGAFELFEYYGRLREWDVGEYNTQAEILLNEILD